MVYAPIKTYRLTLECNGKAANATVQHDLYGKDDHGLALKDLQDALIQLIFVLNDSESVGASILDKPWLRKGFADE